MPRGGKNHSQGGRGKFSRALCACRTVYFFPPGQFQLYALVAEHLSLLGWSTCSFHSPITNEGNAYTILLTVNTYVHCHSSSILLSARFCGCCFRKSVHYCAFFTEHPSLNKIWVFFENFIYITDIGLSRFFLGLYTGLHACTTKWQVEHQRCSRTVRVQKNSKILRKNTIINKQPVSANTQQFSGFWQSAKIAIIITSPGC